MVQQCQNCGCDPCITLSDPEVEDEILRKTENHCAPKGIEPANKNYRFFAYSTFARMLGYAARQPLPTCVMTWVANMWGESQTGFIPS